MKHGASSMFLIGLITYYRENPVEALGAIQAAGDVVRMEQEVCIPLPDVTLMQCVERQWK